MNIVNIVNIESAAVAIAREEGQRRFHISVRQRENADKIITLMLHSHRASQSATYDSLDAQVRLVVDLC